MCTFNKGGSRVLATGSGCDDSAADVDAKALAHRNPMKVHINVAKVTVVLVVTFLSGVLVQLGTARLLSRGPRDSTAAFVFLVGPNTEKDNRTRGLGTALHTLYHHYQVRTGPPPSPLPKILRSFF